MVMRKVIVRLSQKDNFRNTLDLEYDIIENHFTPRWIECYQRGQQRGDPISNPDRFGGLNNEWTQERVFGIDKLTYMVLHAALKRAEEFIEMEDKTQNPKYKCGDYSTGKLLTRIQRRKQKVESYASFIEMGQVLDESCSSSSTMF